MKELSIEEKAQRYDEAITRGSRLLESDMITRENYEYIFPEVKESEDERIRKAIIEHFEGSHSSMYPYKGFTKEQILAWLEKKPSLLTKEKALKNSPFVEQKPAWSEEDEKMFDYALNMIDWYGCVDKDKSKSVSDWLKSIKDRYTWKPSELQIEALESATENCAYSEYQDCLRELIGQLKKLREE